MTEEVRVKMTEKVFFDKCQVIHSEIAMLIEDLSELKATAKEGDIPKERITYISNVAKTVAQCKTERKAAELKGMLDTIEEFT